MWVVIPAPLNGKQFPWVDPKPPMSEYLDWRENLSSGSKISKEKPIENFAIKYLERNFHDLHHVICLPPSIHEKSATNGEKTAKFVSQLFTELFQKKLKEGIRAVLTDYDLYGHACLLNLEYQEPISCKRVVLFYSKANLILIVRVASSPDSINQESQNCSTDVKYFVYVNKPIIENKSLTVLGVVACPSVERKDLKETLLFQFPSNFKLFKVLFICEDELKSYETLHDWWRCKFFEHCSKITCNTKNEILFKQLIGLTMLIIAYYEVESCPSLESNTQKQITSMLLNPEQINAIHDCSLKKVITGGFGCGKSVVGNVIVKSFCMKAAKPSTLYYICCDHFSLLEGEMKDFVDRLEENRNVKVVTANLFKLWRDICEKQGKSEKEIISLPELLQYLGSTAVNGSTTVNFVLDELSGEYVQEKHANQLKELFSSSLKESLVIFITKSIEKHRSIMNNGEAQQMENNCFSEKKLGMKNFTLKSSMRVTCCVQLLIDSAQKTISKSSTVFYQAHKSLGQRKLNQEKVESNIGIETQNTLKSDDIAQDTISKSNTISHQEETNSNERDTKLIKPSENRNFHATQEENPTKNLQESDDETYYDDDLDHAAKILNPQNVVESNNYMETYYGFKHGVSGHSIIGDIPKIIYLPFLNWGEERSAKILSVVLEKICFEEVRSTAVICNNMQEVQCVSYAIDIIEVYGAKVYTPHLRNDLPRVEDKIEVFEEIKKSKQNVLVADIRGMCGIESEVVIVFVQPEEYYLRHEIVDACARSNSYLVLLVLPSKVTASQKGGTVEDVLNNWQEGDVKKIFVKINNDQNELYIKTEQTVSINDQCDEFKGRGADQNFIQHIENERFKTNEKNKLR